MRQRDGACPEHGDNCPYYTPDRTAGTTKPLPRIRKDPDLIRGIERVTGESYDPDTDTWRKTDGTD
jgi:hypothetical protein